jgi:hypothetical protein
MHSLIHAILHSLIHQYLSDAEFIQVLGADRKVMVTAPPMFIHSVLIHCTLSIVVCKVPRVEEEELKKIEETALAALGLERCAVAMPVAQLAKLRWVVGAVSATGGLM